MTLTAKFLKGVSSDDLKRLTKLSQKKNVTVNSLLLFELFESSLSERMRFLDVLAAFRDIAVKSAKLNFKKAPSTGSLNNCAGRWFELIFFKYFRLLLHESQRKGDVREICKLPNATTGRKLADVFIKEQCTALQKIGLATSNPDYLVLSFLRKPLLKPTVSCVGSFNDKSFYGKIDIHNITSVISIKTSARPDRRYQQVYEANMIKAIALRLGKKIRFFSVTLHASEKNEEVYSSPSITSIALKKDLEPSIDRSFVLDRIGDVKRVHDAVSGG